MNKIGISRVQTVTAASARELGLREAAGALIQAVQPGSPAAEAGLQPGDVIRRVNRVRITGVPDLVATLRAIKGESEVVLQVENRGQLRFVSVSLD